jgi:nucleotide-binding universal stress UspA family protein
MSRELSRDARSVVVGYDGSEEARAALRYGAAQAGPSGQLHVVYAYSVPNSALGALSYPDMLDAEREAGRTLLQDALVEGADFLLDVDCHSHVLQGDAADLIERVAKEEEADLIIVGSRGAGRVRALLGSVTASVLRAAACPVVVIPPKAVNHHGFGEVRRQGAGQSA